MACIPCGKKRALLMQQQAAGQAASAQASADAHDELPREGTGEYLVRFMREASLTVLGTVTGRRYDFSQSSTIQSVDAADAQDMLRSRAFKRLA